MSDNHTAGQIYFWAHCALKHGKATVSDEDKKTLIEAANLRGFLSLDYEECLIDTIIWESTELQQGDEPTYTEITQMLKRANILEATKGAFVRVAFEEATGDKVYNTFRQYSTPILFTMACQRIATKHLKTFYFKLHKDAVPDKKDGTVTCTGQQN